MKTIFKIFLYLILFVLVVVIVTPIVFKGKILKIANDQANASLNAKVEFRDVNLSLFKKFPNLYIGLKDVSVVGINEFDGDTLMSFDAFEVSVDVISAIKMDSVKVRAISIVNPVMNAIVLANGKANWDITKPSGEVEEETDTIDDEGGATPTIKLKLFEIVNARISYIDKSSDMSAHIEGFNFNLSGDMSEKLTTLLLNIDISKINYKMDGIPYLKDTRFNLLADIAADMENETYTINKNKISLNELTLGLEGFAKIEGDNIITDARFFTTNTSFKTLLSLVPGVYMTGYEDLKTKGDLKLDGTIKGIMNDEVLPVVDLNLSVKNAMFKYPDLPKQVDNVNIGLFVKYNGVFEDSTTVDLNKFHMEIAGNPIDMTMNVKTPMSDMHVDGNLKANIEFSSLADAIPLEETSISGNLIANIDIMGFLSSIEKEQYEDFKADGVLSLNEFKYKSADLPYDVTINKMEMFFSPRYVNLKRFDMNIGESDIKLNGKLENFIPYVFDNKTIKGSLALSSDYFNVDPFMVEDTTMAVEEVEEDTSAVMIIEVPDNIDFVFKANMGKVLYDGLEISDITGSIIVKDGIAKMTNVNMNTLGGFVNMNAEYNTKDIENPFVDMDLAITNIDISSTVEAFNTIEKLAPISKQAHGNISASINYNSFLENDMSPRMNSIVGGGNLQSKSIKIENAKTFNAIGEKLGSDKFKEVTLNDIDLNFTIRDGKIEVKPFDARIGKGNANIGGVQNLDQTIKYSIMLTMPKSQLGSGAAGALNSLAANAAKNGIPIDENENMNFDIKVSGTVTDPKIELDLKSNAKNKVAAVKEQVVTKAKAEVTKVVDDTKEKANAEAQRIISNAEKQADQLMESAKKAAEIARKEAYDKADKVEAAAEGKPKFARELAKKSADEIRKGGDDKAKKIISDAEKKSDDLIAKARKEAEEKTE